MRPGVVFIGEDFDDEDMHCWPGRWSAHWESDDGQQWREGPQAVSAREAIAWGREHADVVLIRPGDSDTYYSAGVQQPQREAGEDSAECPPWPEGRELPRRRAAGREYLDRSADDPPIAWRIRAGGTLPIARLAQFVDQYAESLLSDDSVEELIVAPRIVEATSFECEFTVHAATIQHARRAALNATDRALAAALQVLGDVGDSAWMSTVEDPEPL